MLFIHTNIYRNGSLFSNKLFSEIFSCVCKIEESISFVSDILKNTQYFSSRSLLQSRIASVCLLVCFYSRESKLTSFLNCFFYSGLVLPKLYVYNSRLKMSSFDVVCF